MSEFTELHGEWWIPEEPESKTVGILYSTDQSSWLEVQQPFRQKEYEDLRAKLHFWNSYIPVRSIPTLLGRSTDGRAFTLENCFVTTFDLTPGYREHILPMCILEGEHLQDQDARVFDHIYTEFTFGNRWTWQDKFDKNDEDEQPKHPGVGTKYSFGFSDPPILRFKDMVFAFRHFIVSEGHDPNGVLLKYYSICDCLSSEKYPAQEWLKKHIALLSRFISFCLGVRSKPFNTFLDLTPIHTSPTTLSRKRIRIYKPDVKENDEYFDSRSFILDIYDLDGYSRVLEHWDALEREFQPLVSAYFENLNASNFEDSHTRLLAYTQALESTHRRLTAGDPPDAKLQDKIRRVLLQIDDDQDRKWLERKLKRTSEANLETRLLAFFQKYEDILKSIGMSNASDAAKDCATVRNGIVHDDAEKISGSKYGIGQMNDFLVTVIRGQILELLHFSRSDIERILQNVPSYDQLRSVRKPL